MTTVILGSPACDYLRLTTFDYREFLAVRSLLPRLPDDVAKDDHIPRYAGMSWAEGRIFAGIGTQQSVEHYLIQASGSSGHDALWKLVRSGHNFHEWKCTRIDIQLSLELPSGYWAREVKDFLESTDPADWLTGHKSPCDLHEGRGRGEKGLDTIEVGGRTSERYSRMYVKLLAPLPEVVNDSVPYLADDTLEKWLRYEVEYKKSAADSVFHAILGGASPSEFLRHAWERIPFGHYTSPGGWLHDMHAAIMDSSPSDPAYTKRVVDAPTTLKWFRESVEPAVLRLANDHDVGPAVRQWLIDLILKADPFRDIRGFALQE